jgi:hypothetical protein
MNLLIDIKKMKEAGITPNQHLILYLIFTKDREEIAKIVDKVGPFSIEDVNALINKGFLFYAEGLKTNPSNLADGLVTMEAMKYLDQTPFDEFFQKWIDLWPVGLKRQSEKGGSWFYLRAEADSKKDMRKWLKNNPKYTQRLVLEVTKRYLEERAMDDYKFCRRSDYFIYKDGKSDLLLLCENYDEKDYFEIPRLPDHKLAS